MPQHRSGYRKYLENWKILYSREILNRGRKILSLIRFSLIVECEITQSSEVEKLEPLPPTAN